MAIDGSFSLESQLERFLARCPKLACIPQFDSLLKKRNDDRRKGSEFASGAVYTPKIYNTNDGMFRPICRKIVDKAVALLRLVPNLRYNSNGTLTEVEEDKLLGEAGNFEDAGDASVIEFFARNGWGLNLHELACLAFCRALDLAPFLLGVSWVLPSLVKETLLGWHWSFVAKEHRKVWKAGPLFTRPCIIRSSHPVVDIPFALVVGHAGFYSARSTLSYFRFAPPPFERMLIKGSVSELPAKKLANLDMVDDDKFVKNISDIRWCGLQILFVILKMNDTAIANFGIGAEEALGCLLRWEELCEDVAQEKAGWYFESSKQQKPDSINPDIDFDQENCLRFFGLNNLAVSSSQFPEAQPSTRIRRLVTWNGDSCGNPLVLTLSLKKSYEMVLLAVSQKWPVLLYGPAGVGKTALISKLARDSGNQVLSIHMDDQIDGKTLIGSYVCMERPGEFRWQPGSLTQAAMNGFWVVFEGIDKAPSDVQSILLPLLEGEDKRSLGGGFCCGEDRKSSTKAFNMVGYCLAKQLPPISRADQTSRKMQHANWFMGCNMFCQLGNCYFMDYVLVAIQCVDGHKDEAGFQDGHSHRCSSLLSQLLTRPGSGGKGWVGLWQIPGGNSLGVLWRRVMIGHPSNEDLQSIVKAWYPELEPVAGKLIETFERVNYVPLYQLGGFQSGNHPSFSCLSRDLLKWCKRIAALGFHFLGDGLSADACKCIFLEAVDIFAAFSASAENRLTIMRELAKMWAVSDSVAEAFYPPNKPVIQDLGTDLTIGRVTLHRHQRVLRHQKKLFVEIRSSLHLLERIACSVKCNEPVLLVGETGTGKTTLVQTLAMRLGQKLTVLNLSQQSDVADLLGGFKPMDAQFVCIPLYKDFENLFSKTFSVKDNGEFLARLQHHLSDKNWKMLMTGFKKGVDFFRKSAEIGKSGSGKKRKKSLDETVLKAWEDFSVKLDTSRGQIGASSGMLFQFVEGAFVTALRNGDWILLDEVNLAPPETLQRVIGVLEDVNGSLCLAERGDASYIPRHPNFRLFACMNPATDAGKRDLPYSLRSRFTEYFVDDVLDDKDLTLFITQSLDDSCSSGDLVDKIVSFYKAAKKESEERLQDGANQKPQYSLRSLYRAIEYTNKAKRKFGFQKAIYDGFSMFFLTLLDVPSAKLMNQMILSKVLGGKIPPQVPFDEYLMVRGSTISGDFLENYILTKSVREHLRNLARAVLIKRYPVLLQGPTSSGKTSLVQYLAAITGHEFVRINNHEHTDLQEYLGSYVTDASGKLVFHEGVLVKAVRNGYWIVLDELNLAPSDVLEALNRLLDDNRELFVPELRETIPAHPDFMLFATQNPPTLYGGRKMLSRAFRNRFVEIHVDEIPEDELSTILDKRCKIPESYAKKMVEVMKELELHRQSSKVFAGKHGFITPRDLFRWADRFRTFGNSCEDLARDGYYLLAERLRDEGEKKVVQAVLEKHLRVKLVKDNLYHQVSSSVNCVSVHHTPGKKLGVGDNVFSSGKHAWASESLGDIIWTKSMRRLYFLVECCYRLREPILLVGETGGGKTTICQLLSAVLGLKLHILNCHQYTETSDFLGGFYPIRERSRLISEFKFLIEQLMMLKAFVDFPGDISISSDIGHASQTLDQLDVIVNSYQQGITPWADVTRQDLDTFVRMKLDLAQLHQKWQTIFMWQDGPLVQAMKDGDLFLVDEISLADDSVLERLNSVLEPERKLALAEKGGSSLEIITAHPNFFLLATMNPGGDYGKKELSPALRNRFTEIWVPCVSDLDELRSIALQRFSNPKILWIVDPMLNFWEWFNQLQTGRALTVRDLLSWVAFINVTEKSLQPDYAFLHGAFLVLLDGLSLEGLAVEAGFSLVVGRLETNQVEGTGISKEDAGRLRENCLSFLVEQLKLADLCLVVSELSRMENYSWGDLGTTADSSCSNNMQLDNHFGIHPFYIEKGDQSCEIKGFEFLAPTTCKNAFRVLRAMQLAKPGSPGVGKTSLIVALGKFSGHPVVRINLSEQTDIMDLLGSDLPVESSEGIKFAWSDGILLQVEVSYFGLEVGFLLDELNLAPQSVLEGLNAILDHRAEVFIPELGVTFKCPSSFRVFACQNPSSQGGGRKGLPRSFLNRFTKVYVDELVEDDYLFICSSLYPSIQRPILSKLILFNKRLHEDIMLNHKFAQDGSPWEFNLRDVIRSCEIIEECERQLTAEKSCGSMNKFFQVKPYINPYPRVQLNHRYLVVGNTSIRRNHFQSSKISNSQLKILPGIRQSLEAVAHCVQRQWLCILVGPSSSGKTSLIRLLAHSTGNVLNELSLSSATDISELLGCFEQYNAFRNFRSVVGQVECYVNEYCSLQLESSMEAFISERRDMITDGLLSCQVWIVVHHQLLLLLIWKIGSVTAVLYVCFCKKISRKEQLQAKFEWVTGLLIKALENGEWIVLDNANLCNPTVLDRINSLVEPCGSSQLMSVGLLMENLWLFILTPIFECSLRLSPSHGDVSRAMRNRGVEIFMMQPYWPLDQESDYYFEELELKDVKRFLVLSDIPGEKLVEAMAKAHIYARDEGLGLNVHITYLELARWVQLFLQLLMNGNQPLWSLQISWEHTYLSSLGEIEGEYIIAHARTSYLSAVEFSEFDSSLGCSLCLPGGWPRPLRIRDLVYHSREVGVKQNCMYLEFLGTQYASCELGVAWDRQTKFNAALIDKMLLFAANWTIEQATESDLKLYLLWFSWFNSRLLPFCQFFNSFLTQLKEELKHSYLELYNWLLPRLCNAINSIGLLRRSLQQWNAESGYNFTDESRSYIPVLRSLQVLEDEVLNALVESPSFDLLIQLLTNLLEDHILFWNSVTSSKFDYLLISWHSLMKDAMKLRDFFPKSVKHLLVRWRSEILIEFHFGIFILKSLCYGFMAVIQICPLLLICTGNSINFYVFCEFVWPTKTKSWEQVDDRVIDAVVSSSPDLRFLAMQVLRISSSPLNLLLIPIHSSGGPASFRFSRKEEMEDLLLRDEVQWRPKATEVCKAVFGLDKEKASELHGFTIALFQEC
ncbi:Midasin [Vitis vinifera]|uniref:Midasin n=1 Tax=Vitis vinifera TaxID=29760 RepID=A0A438EWH2_VITVI|nr:Midasin [Vitis vinifera]